MSGTPPQFIPPSGHHHSPADLRVRLAIKLADARACHKAADVADANGDRDLADQRRSWAAGHEKLADQLRQQIARAALEAQVPA